MKQQNSFKKGLNSLLAEIDSKYKSLEKELYTSKNSADVNARVCVGMVVLSIRKDIKMLKKFLRNVIMENKLIVPRLEEHEDITKNSTKNILQI